MANLVIIDGSPKKGSVSERLSEYLSSSFDTGNVRVFHVNALVIEGCIGCDWCREQDECFRRDEMDDITATLDQADRLIVVSPLYFAGVPSQLKALLDRLQPYYWKREKLKANKRLLPPKRSCSVVLLGEGNDPHGHQPALVTLRSAFALADFKIDQVVVSLGPGLSFQDIFNRLFAQEPKDHAQQRSAKRQR